MRINYNISSIIAQNALNNNDMHLTASTQRLSSGYKINSAKDNAAGLAIARKMSMQIKSLQRANSNANDGVSVVDTADGAMTEMHSILQRMNELAVQAANGTNADSDRAQIQEEIDQLVYEIDRIADTTQFNAQNLLDGSFAYKAYTNSENVKVMEYSEEVNKGIYLINTITYNRYGTETITYKDGSQEVKDDVDFKVSSADDLKDALNMVDYDEYNIKGFPAGSSVTLDDEYIYVKDDNGFEIKLYVNDRQNVMQTTVTTVTVPSNQGGQITMNSLISTSTIPSTAANDTVEKITYKYVDVLDDNGNKFTINTLISKTEDGTTILYSDDNKETYKDLEADLNIDYITKVELDNGNKEIKVTYNNDSYGITQSTVTFKIDGVDSNGNDKDIDAFYYSKSERERTTYTVGSDAEPLAIDITKMGAMIVQVGANEGQYLEIEIPALNTINLGIDGLDLSTEDAATDAIDIVGNAINYLSSVRAKIGAYANRLEHTITSLDTQEENLTSAYSRIMDVDMAEEITEYTNQQVLVQAATSVLAQANERPQQVLQLLQ